MHSGHENCEIRGEICGDTEVTSSDVQKSLGKKVEIPRVNEKQSKSSKEARVTVKKKEEGLKLAKGLNRRLSGSGACAN